jgi:hypothetical protein
MKPEALLQLLETTAQSLAVKVSYEQLAMALHNHAGGLCRVKGQYRVIIDKRATPEERVATLAASLAKVISDDQRQAQPAKVRDCLAYYAA